MLCLECDIILYHSVIQLPGYHLPGRIRKNKAARHDRKQPRGISDKTFQANQTLHIVLMQGSDIQITNNLLSVQFVKNRVVVFFKSAND